MLYCSLTASALQKVKNETQEQVPLPKHNLMKCLRRRISKALLMQDDVLLKQQLAILKFQPWVHFSTLT